MKKSEWFLIAAVLVFFVTGLAFYPLLPGVVASHWNARGEANGYLSREWGVFLLPIIFIFVALLFFLIPRIDPRRENIAKFRSYFDYFVVAISAFFYYIYLLSLLWNIGYQFSFVAAMMPAFAILFAFLGFLMPHLEPNWMMGIRTPWTLSSETVWEKTHRLGGKLFAACGAVALMGIFLPRVALWLLVGPVIATAIALILYSYVLYERERKQ